MAVINVRPHIVFDLIDQNSDEGHSALFRVPNKFTYTGSPTALEKFCIYALMQFTKPLKIFEFGTFMGTTTRMFHDNTSEKVHITTIDIGHVTEQVLERDSSKDAINLIRKVEKNGFHQINGLDRITQIISDSTLYDYSLLSDFDFIWIDGGHDLFVVKPDTENSFKIISRSNKNACIAWHDYGSATYPDLKIYV
ncbi:MAG: class I SAM-dependent methyltransferase, partial [Crocinitomicaceae bacterium]|nr:class I SAM-dependent methyltransferase [Crocinitomicaceae bacterium]